MIITGARPGRLDNFAVLTSAMSNYEYGQWGNSGSDRIKAE